MGIENQAASKIISNFGRKCEILIIENDVNLKTFILDKESLMFYINSNGMFYFSEVTEFETLEKNTAQQVHKNVLTNNFDQKSPKPDAVEKQKPQLPSTAKPGFNAMLSNLGISESFQTYSDLIRKIGFFQSQITIAQTLVSFKFFILSTKPDSDYTEIEKIILYLEAFFEDLRMQCQTISGNNEKFHESINGIFNTVKSPLNNLRLTFDKNKKAWPDLIQFYNKCFAETAWIKSTQIILSNCETGENYKEVSDFYIKLDSEVKKHKEQIFKLEIKAEELDDMAQDDIFGVFYNVVNEKWNIFQQNFKAFSVENVEKEIDEMQKVFELSDSIIDSTTLANDLQKNTDNLKVLSDLIKESLKKEETLIKRYYEFKTNFEALKTWILDSCSFLTSEEKNLMTTEISRKNHLTINDSIKSKGNEIEELDDKVQKLEADGISGLNDKMMEIQESWKHFMKYLSKKNNDKDHPNANIPKNLSTDNNHLSPKLKLKKSCILDESFRSFWQNRRPQSFQSNQHKSFDDNWLKRMSKISEFNSPSKYTSFNTSINAIGIDLGTSSCFAAVNLKDKIETVALDYTGERVLPSYIGFDESDAKCGKVVVNHLGSFSKSTIFDSKRIIGKTFEEITVDPTWPFEVIEEGGKVKLQFYGHSGTIMKNTVEEVTSILLLHIKQKAEELQGRSITNVVITIPAAFTESQKETTLEAAKLAGFEKVDLLPEPVAASFAYFIDRPLPNNATILLFDLGGGTLDICIFEIQNSAFKIIRNTGDANIGGRNFDKLLYEYFKDELLERHGINVGKRKYKLMLKCQDIKETLSARYDSQIDVDEYGAPVDAKPIKITRQQFEEMSSNLLNDIEVLLEYATDGLQDKIEKVLLVGGGSRMPLIKSMLESMFPNAVQCCEKHPEEVVATGAAYYSYHLAYKKQSRNN
uniref:Uncharacterized protein n=1 Tax=Panagrolaimus sp. ES5 TaxID=591445 RepID=A0AC34F1A0_9BILA